MREIENTAAILVEKEGKILLVRRKNETFNGFWCLPGGHSEPGEEPADTAQREGNEEVGGVTVQGEPIMVFAHDWPGDSHVPENHVHRAHLFLGRVTGELKAGDDAAELGWFSPEEALSMDLTGYTRFIIEERCRKG